MHVLLVDDSEDTRWIAKRALARRGGVKITEAESAEAAMALLRAVRVDAILTDYNMPGATGVDLLCHAQKKQPHARRVLMSGTLDAVGLREMEGAACVDHAFEKPFTMTEWSSALSAALPALG